MFFEEFLGQRGDHLGIGDARAHASVGHAIRLGQRLGDLIFRAKSHLDQHFTEQFLMVGALLLLQRALQVLVLDEALVEQQLTQLFSFLRRDHAISSFSKLRARPYDIQTDAPAA